jgi:hypothetical protein
MTSDSGPLPGNIQCGTRVIIIGIKRRRREAEPGTYLTRDERRVNRAALIAKFVIPPATKLRSQRGPSYLEFSPYTRA